MVAMPTMTSALSSTGRPPGKAAVKSVSPPGPVRIKLGEDPQGLLGTGVSAIRDDMANARTDWADERTVVGGDLISARTPADLGPWMKALLRAIG